MVVEAGNRLQLSAPTVQTTPLTSVACLLLRLLLHLPRRHRRLSLSYHACCVEVLLLRALARMRQIVAPLWLRNLLIGHHGKAALRLVRNNCNLAPIEASGIMTTIKTLKPTHRFSKIAVAQPVAHGTHNLTCCRWLWKSSTCISNLPMQR